MANDGSRVALVTGASRGIGKQCALALAARGFDVVIAARTLEPGEMRERSETVRKSDPGPLPGSLRETAEAIAVLGQRALPLRTDLTRNTEIDALVERALTEFGRVDVLVNDARYVGPGQRDLFLDTPHAILEEMVQVNLVAPLYLIRRLVPAMIAQGGGVVFDVSSGAGIDETPALPNGHWDGGWGVGYSFTKAALNRLAAGLAKELRQHAIAVVNLEPGLVVVERKIAERAGTGFDPTEQAPPEVVGLSCAYIATCPQPMYYSGRTVFTPEFAIEHGLIDPDRVRRYGRARWGLPNWTSWIR
jgi:NAD(P)-dependent dehydrogenase (short-subunit alcohol dehydrogenase family)